ncbi:hypothetical protein M1271_00215 [Patescibacteria group bacterium]|nr:hypothetical protein [Patescibacteria group bacterium]
MSFVKIGTRKSRRLPFRLDLMFLAVGIIFILSGVGVGFHQILKASSEETSSVLSAQDSLSDPLHDPFYQRILHTKTVDSYPPNNYFPESYMQANHKPIDITARAYAVFDRDSRQLLYGRNLVERMPIASVVKIMTAIVALENAPLDTIYTVPSRAAQVGEASMGLSLGERLTEEELLYGLLLPSGNDAAETLASGIGKYRLGKLNGTDVTDEKGRNWFIHAMNQKAQDLGMMDTYFFNPTGLDEETPEISSFSSALDLVALTNYALQNPTFAKVVDTHSIDLPYKDGFHKEFYLENILQLSGSFDGIKGVKPGNSVFARETLVSYDELNGRRIIVVILGSDHTKDDALEIYKQVFGE